MVTLIKYGALSGGEKYNVNVLSIDGLSTDTKPTVTYIEYGSDGREVGRMGIPNGSIFTEIDTGDTYMYDADNATWHRVSIGGGGGEPPVFIEKTITENGTYVASDDGASGYSSVSVEVPSAPTPETFEVTIDGTISSPHSQNLTADKSIAEVVSAFNNGIVLINFGDSVKSALLNYDITLNEYPNFCFKYISESETALIGTVGYILSNNMMHISLFWSYSEDYSTSTIEIML